ncbi:MAG: hypothetical protein ACOC29_00490, partial [Candidatus Sumerlaeota bacterium]
MKWLDDKTRRREQIFRALLVLGLFIFYGPLIWGDIPSGADITLMFGPFYSAGWDGGPPLWARYHLGGAGLYNNLQSEILYPLRWPFFFVDWRSYFGLFNFLHYAAALFGMAVFARALRFGRTASLLAAFAFAMGGQMVARLMNPTILYAYSWLPWLLYGALSRRRRRRWITTASMAMICLLGSPHGILYGLVGFSMVFLITREWRNPKDVAKTAARDIAHLALAAVLAAPTLIAGLRRAGQSLRSRADVSLNLADSMTFGEIPLSLLGGSGGANYPEYNDLTSFVGAIVLALVIASAAFPRSWRDRRFFVGLSLSLSGLIFALGENIGLQTIMPHVPVFSKLAGPMRGMVLTALGAPLLAAIGLERLREAGKTRWIAFGLAVPVAVILLVSAFRFFRESYFPGAGSGAVWPWWRAWIERPDCVFPPLFFFINAAVGLLLFALTGLLTLRSRRTFAIVIVGLVFCDLLHFAPRVRPPTLAREVFDPPENIRFLQERMREEGPFRVAGYEPLRRGDADFFEAQKFERLMPNLAGIYGLEQIQGFDPLVPLRQVETFEQCGLRSPLDDPVRGLQFTYPDPGLFRLMGVRYLVGDPHMRRLTSIPQVLEPRQPVQSVDLEPGKMTGWLAATSYAAPAPLRPGMAVCVLEVTTSDGEIHRYPVRSAIETHHVAMPQSSLPLFQQWTTPIPLAPGR